MLLYLVDSNACYMLLSSVDSKMCYACCFLQCVMLPNVKKISFELIFAGVVNTFSLLRWNLFKSEEDIRYCVPHPSKSVLGNMSLQGSILRTHVFEFKLVFPR